VVSLRFELDARRRGLVGGIPGDQAAYRNSDYSANLIPIQSLSVKGAGAKKPGVRHRNRQTQEIRSPARGGAGLLGFLGGTTSDGEGAPSRYLLTPLAGFRVRRFVSQASA